MQNVVVGIDGSPAALNALPWAVHAARQRGDRLVLMSCYQQFVYTDGFAGAYADPTLPEQLRNSSERLLEAAAAEVTRLDPSIEVETRTVEGDAPHHLVTAAQPTDLVVVGSNGRTGFFHDLIGSTATAIAHHATCAVMVVPPNAAAPTDGGNFTVRVGVDGGESSQLTLAWAYGEALRNRARLDVLHVWSYPYSPGRGIYEMRSEVRADAQHLLDSVIERIAHLAAFEEGAVEVTATLVEESPSSALLTNGAPGLIVVGSHGRGSVRSFLLGSVSRTAIEHAKDCPVVVVRQPRPAHD